MTGRLQEKNDPGGSRYSRFLLLWCGELISAIGGGLTSFGLGVYVFGLTRSAASMALVSLLAFLPALVLSVPAGVLADRYDRLKLMMAGDGLSALGLIYILACMKGGGASLSQILIGVTISSVFSSLLEPSYRAVLSDLLPREEYSRASGLVNMAGSAKYLISPLLAGLLLSLYDVTLLLWIDIGTFFVTILCTGVVRKSLSLKKSVEKREGFFESLREGWRAVTQKRGVVTLIFVSSVMTCFMGTMQILSEPMILDFRSSRVLGIAETICATGMLLSGLLIGIRGLRKGYVRILSTSLTLAGLFMIGFGAWEDIRLIVLFGFLFFFMLPFANNCLDYLVRTNLSSRTQGRAWGLIGLLSQLGYVVAYAFSGILADGLASRMGMRVGRGAALLIALSGGLLMVLALALGKSKEVRRLERATEEDDDDEEEEEEEGGAR